MSKAATIVYVPVVSVVVLGLAIAVLVHGELVAGHHFKVVVTWLESTDNDDGLEPDFSPAVVARDFWVMCGYQVPLGKRPNTPKKSLTTTAGEKSGSSPSSFINRNYRRHAVSNTQQQQTPTRALKIRESAWNSNEGGKTESGPLL